MIHIHFPRFFGSLTTIFAGVAQPERNVTHLAAIAAIADRASAVAGLPSHIITLRALF